MAVEPGIGNNVREALPLFAAAFHGLSTPGGLSIHPKPKRNHASTKISFEFDHPLQSGNYPSIPSMLSQLEFHLYASNHRSMRYPFWSLDGFDELRSRARSCRNSALDKACSAMQATKMRAVLRTAVDDMDSLRILARWFHESITGVIDAYVVDHPDLKQACLVTPQEIVNTLNALAPVIADKRMQIGKEVRRKDVCITINFASPHGATSQEITDRLPWLNNRIRLRLTQNSLVLEGRRAFNPNNAARFGSDYSEDEIPPDWRLPFPEMETLTPDAILNHTSGLIRHWIQKGQSLFPDLYNGPWNRAPKEVQKYYSHYVD